MSLYKGTQLIAGAGGGSEEDNLSITKNASDKIQTVGVIDQNDSSLAIKIWTGTQAEYDAIVTKDSETEYIITDDIGGSANVFRKEVSERNIGEIVYSSIPITDSGFHLADGEVLDGTGIYKDFYDYMVAKSTSAPEIFTTEASWQAEVAVKGVCGKYVLDTGLISIRLPKLKNKLLSDNAVVGNGMTLGMTNGSVNIGLGSQKRSSYDGMLGTATAIYGTNVGTGVNLEGVNRESLGITTDSTKSGIEVASSVDIYCYVIIANTAKVPVQVDIDNITTELNACYAHRVVEFQVPTAANNYTWYRKYADGWIEQGGETTTDASTQTVNLPIEMSNTSYAVLITMQYNSTNALYSRNIGIRTTTSFTAKCNNTRPFVWQVSGMVA